MNLRVKQFVDYYVGGALIFFLKPSAYLLGKVLRRRHDLTPRRNIYFVKMLGGGSLVIALPALLGLRNRYPDREFVLVTTPRIVPFARTLAIFDRFVTIDDRSILRLLFSSIIAWFRCLAADTIVDFEVYSRLSTVFCTLTCARNRIGFYLTNVFWRQNLSTHLIFFNQFSGAYLFYDHVCFLLGGTPAQPEECRLLLLRNLTPQPPMPGRAIALGPGCSDFATERMLSPEQWIAVFERRLHREEAFTVFLLGSAADRGVAEAIEERLRQNFPNGRILNTCGELTLTQSLSLLTSAQEFWGIDSALIHYARLFGIQSLSFWGPSAPDTRLRPIPYLTEEVYYMKVSCSPCVHVAERPPCGGKNICIQSLFDNTMCSTKLPHTLWIVSGNESSS